MIRVLLFEDNRNFREALEEALNFSKEVSLVGAYENAERATKLITELQPHVVLMDIEMPGISGLDALTEIKAMENPPKVMIQTQFEDAHRIFVALSRGASGYALKSDTFEKLEEAIQYVFKGGGYFSPPVAMKLIQFFQEKEIDIDPEYYVLTPRELEVLSLLGDALTYKEIAGQMHLSFDGVHSHVKNIYKKLHVKSRAEAVKKATTSKLI